MSENLCKNCGTPVEEEQEYCSSCQQPTESTSDGSYIDYIVEEEVAPKKSYPLMKLIALIVGVLGGIGVSVYAITTIAGTAERLKMYLEMGVEVPPLEIFAVFSSLVLLLILGICVIVGAALPVKFTKVSVFLLGMPAAWGISNGLPQFILNASSPEPIPFAESYPIMMITFGGFLTLVAGILNIIASKEKQKECCCVGAQSGDSYSNMEEMPTIVYDEAEDAQESAEETQELTEETPDASEESEQE